MADSHRRSRFIGIGFLAACAGISGCAGQGAPAGPRVASDLRKPKSAALTFYQALAAGDRQTAEEASVGSKEQKQWIAATVALLDGLRGFDQALLKRFGPEATQADAGLRQAVTELADGPVARLRDGIVRESEQEAVVYPAYAGVRLSARSPVYLRKLNRQWKVDLAAMESEPGHDRATAARYREAGDALQRAAREMRGDRYRTFAEAEQSLNGRAAAAPQ